MLFLTMKTFLLTKKYGILYDYEKRDKRKKVATLKYPSQLNGTRFDISPRQISFFITFAFQKLNESALNNL